MLKIKGYLCDGDLEPAANGYVGTGTRIRDDKRVFFKQFDRYVAPSHEALATGSASALRRREEFAAYQAHLAALDSCLVEAGGPHSCLVAPVDVVQSGNKLIHVTELVDTAAAVPVEQVHRLYPRTVIMAMFEHVLQSVDALHRQGVVLIDIKDANVFVIDEGCGPRCLLFDFDDAVFEGKVPDASRVVGTPEYFSPELAAYIARAEGDDSLGRAGSPLAHAIDRHHDIFALGLLLHLLLTGSLPNGRTPVWRAIARRGDEALILDRSLQAADRALLTWMLRRNPADRPASCAQIVERLDPLCTAVPRFGNPPRPARTTTPRRAGIRPTETLLSRWSPVSTPAPAAALVFDPPRDGIFSGVTPLEGDRVQIVCTNGTVLTKPVAELALYGLGDQVETVRKEAIARFGKGW